MILCYTANDVLSLLIYIDDILVISCNSSQVSSHIASLNAFFALRDLG